MLAVLGLNTKEAVWCLPRQLAVWVKHQQYSGYLITASLAINILSLALPLMTLQVYDRVLAYQNQSTLSVLVIGTIVFILLEFLLRMARSYLIGRAGMEYEYQLSCKAMERVVHTEQKNRAGRNVSVFMQDFAAIGKTRDFHGGQALTIILDIPFIFMFLALIGYLAGWLVIVPLVLLVQFGLIAWLFGEKLKSALHARETSDDKRFGFIIEALSGIHSLKSLALEAPMQRRYEGLQADAANINYRVAEQNGITTTAGQIFAQLMLVSVVTAGAPMVLYGYLTTGTLIACLLLSGRIMQPMQRALQLWARFQDYRVANDRVQYILNLPQPTIITATETMQNDGLLTCRNVTFGYDSGTPMVIENVSLSLEPGITIAIKGNHSSGKTTLLKMMAGLYTPVRGSVQLNGHEASQVPASELVKQVGYMPTEGVIYRGTIMENLTGLDEHRRGAAMEIAGLLGIDDAVARSPRGYDTMLEGSAIDIIPPGLRQRIAIARVLLEKPRLLLFDNADRALDREGYNHMFELLGKLKGRTTIVLVSEDKNIQHLADTVYTIHRGRLIEESSLLQTVT